MERLTTSDSTVSVKELKEDSVLFTLFHESKENTEYCYTLNFADFENSADENDKTETQIVGKKVLDFPNEKQFDFQTKYGYLYFYSSDIIDLFNELN